MTELLEWALLILLVISVSLNIVLLKKVRDLNSELREVGARVSVTKEELFQIRRRLERMKNEI